MRGTLLFILITLILGFVGCDSSTPIPFCGYVIDRDTGEGIVDATVELQLTPPIFTDTVSRGYFSFNPIKQRIPTAHVNVVVTANGYMRSDPIPVRLPECPSGNQLRIRLKKHTSDFPTVSSTLERATTLPVITPSKSTSSTESSFQSVTQQPTDTATIQVTTERAMATSTSIRKIASPTRKIIPTPSISFHAPILREPKNESSEAANTILRWEPVAGLPVGAKYEILLWKEGEAKSTKGTTTETKWDLMDLAAEARYFWSIRILDQNGKLISEESETRSFTIRGGPRPTERKGVEPTEVVTP